MSKALEFIKGFYADPSFVALKEWIGPNGEMGVYTSKRSGYTYILILVDAEKRVFYQHQYNLYVPVDSAVQEAEIVAAFAGAQGTASIVQMDEQERNDLHQGLMRSHQQTLITVFMKRYYPHVQFHCTSTVPNVFQLQFDIFISEQEKEVIVQHLKRVLDIGIG